MFGHGDLLAAALAREPGALTAEAAERAIAGLERDGGLHAAKGLESGRHWTTDGALARESEAIALMRPARAEDDHAGLIAGRSSPAVSTRAEGA